MYLGTINCRWSRNLAVRSVVTGSMFLPLTVVLARILIVLEAETNANAKYLDNSGWGRKCLREAKGDTKGKPPFGRESSLSVAQPTITFGRFPLCLMWFSAKATERTVLISSAQLATDCYCSLLLMHRTQVRVQWLHWNSVHNMGGYKLWVCSVHNV